MIGLVRGVAGGATNAIALNSFLILFDLSAYIIEGKRNLLYFYVVLGLLDVGDFGVVDNVVPQQGLERKGELKQH